MIRDNGAGIKETDLPRIWEIFYSGDNPKLKKGEGIGLAISRMLAEKTGGRLWAESKEGEGSVFFLEMPL
jgi:signal transduction histidine kinase